jgi:hypothetical protein
VLNCGHMFHEDCVKEWMTRARLARCPICRSGLASPRVDSVGSNSQPLHQSLGDTSAVPEEIDCPQTQNNNDPRYIV